MLLVQICTRCLQAQWTMPERHWRKIMAFMHGRQIGRCTMFPFIEVRIISGGAGVDLREVITTAFVRNQNVRFAVLVEQHGLYAWASNEINETKIGIFVKKIIEKASIKKTARIVWISNSFF